MDASIPCRCRAPWPSSADGRRQGYHRRLAVRLGLPFIDADDEIETRGCCSIPEIRWYGEADAETGSAASSPVCSIDPRMSCRLAAVHIDARYAGSDAC